MSYKIIKIQNNNDYNKFYLDITKMKDPRIRVGILVSYFKYYKKKPEIVYHPVFEVLKDGEFSFSVVYKSDICSFQEIQYKRDEVRTFYENKYKNEKAKKISNIITFE